MRNRDGFTLLELVAALSLSAVIGIWAAGFSAVRCMNTKADADP